MKEELNIFSLGLVSVLKTNFSLTPSLNAGCEGKSGWGDGRMRCWNLRCEIALLCGALAGTLSPAERRASATSLHQTDTLRWPD